MTSRLRRTSYASAGLAVAVGALVASLVSASHEPVVDRLGAGECTIPVSVLNQRMGPPEVFRQRELLLKQRCRGDATESTIAGVRNGLPYTLRTPSVGLAETSSLTHVGRTPGSSEVELDYSSGVRIFESVATLRYPKAAWQDIAAQDPESTSVGTVEGKPALLLDPRGAAKGLVSVVLGGTDLVLEGNGSVPIDRLTAVADSLHEAG